MQFVRVTIYNANGSAYLSQDFFSDTASTDAQNYIDGLVLQDGQTASTSPIPQDAIDEFYQQYQQVGAKCISRVKQITDAKSLTGDQFATIYGDAGLALLQRQLLLGDLTNALASLNSLTAPYLGIYTSDDIAQIVGIINAAGLP